MIKKGKLLLFLALLAFLLFLFLRVNRQPKKLYTCPNCNVILIVVDALRPDHLGCYGYPRNTSPNTDKVAEESIIFSNAFSQATFTLASFRSFFTSLYPSEIYNFSLGSKNYSELSSLYTSRLNLAEVLKQNDYVTLGFANDPYASSLYGFNKGFDFFDEKGAFDGKYAGIESVNERVIEKLKEIREKKFFLLIHYMDVHCPYTPPERYLKMYDFSNSTLNLTGKCGWPDFNSMNLTEEDTKKIIAAYDGGIRYTDEEMSKLLTALDSLSLLNNTIIIITADHGEELKDHGLIGHGHSVYDELIHVPLIIKIPGAENKVVDDQVELIDIFPTVLDILGISIPNQLEGKSLLPLITGQKKLNKTVYSEIFNFISVRTPEFKLIINKQTGEKELYYLKNDIKEQLNVLDDYPKVAEMLEKEMLSLRKQ
jgi:arylsulfatase A-like enzyme